VVEKGVGGLVYIIHRFIRIYIIYRLVRISIHS